ncbi:MAG TPA: hypothetical protein VI895_02010 [Bdellovibrionota bacterium]|nr:hypothetical protein [Bdellovibrionota bacterium]
MSKSEGEREGIRVTKELIDVAFEEGIRHFYLVAPLRRYDLAAEIVTYIKKHS